MIRHAQFGWKRIEQCNFVSSFGHAAEVEGHTKSFNYLCELFSNLCSNYGDKLDTNQSLPNNGKTMRVANGMTGRYPARAGG